MRGLIVLSSMLVVLAASASAPRAAAPNYPELAAAAIKEAWHLEDYGTALLREPPNWDYSNEMVTKSLAHIDDAIDAVKEGARTGQINGQAAATAEGALAHAEVLDHQALDLIRNKHDFAKAKALIQKATALKRKAGKTVRAGQTKTTPSGHCQTEKAFDLYAVPEGPYTAAYADVFPHVPGGATNISVRFVDAKTGKPAPAQPFPGQTWTYKIVGTPHDGKLDVHIDVTGPGYGKQDEHFVEWKVIVTFDLPGGCPK